MAGFSIDAALKSGFALARRDWKAILVWGAGYMLLTVAMQVLQLTLLGAAVPGYFQTLLEDPAAAGVMAEQAPPAVWLLTAPLMLILGGAGVVLFYGAVCRALLRPEQRGFFYVKFGRGELWMFLTALALCALALLAVLPISFGFFTLLDLLGGGQGRYPLAGVLLAIPATLAYVYIAARFSLAWVQAWDEERFVLLDAWRLTRGQGWRIVLTILALIFLMLIIWAVVLIPLAIVAGIVLGVAEMSGGGAAMVVTSLLALGGLIFFTVFAGVIYTAMAAPYVDIYRALKAGAADASAAG